MECHPDRNAVFKNAEIAEEQSLSQNQRHDRHIHRIPDIAIETADDETARRKDGRRRTQTLNREACEGIQQDRQTCDHQQYSENSKREDSGQWRLHLPPADQPGEVPRNRSRGNDQEDC